MNKAVFLDKDGTIIHDLPYNVNPSLITWQEGSFEALKRLHEKGYLLVIITNQSGVARGLFQEKDLKVLEEAMRATLQEKGIPLAGFYYCPHHVEGTIKEYMLDCECRKPKAGMLMRAAADLKIDLPASWMVGDILNDVEAGNKAGCRTVLINNGNETEWISNEHRKPAYTAKNILEATNYILNSEKHSMHPG